MGKPNTNPAALTMSAIPASSAAEYQQLLETLSQIRITNYSRGVLSFHTFSQSSPLMELQCLPLLY